MRTTLILITAFNIGSFFRILYHYNARYRPLVLKSIVLNCVLSIDRKALKAVGSSLPKAFFPHEIVRKEFRKFVSETTDL
jgi:hypothetical protein